MDLSFDGNVLESHERSWARDLRHGVVPTVELEGYSHFDIAAVGGLLLFWAATQAGKLPISQCPPVKVILPVDERARSFLLRLKIFQFAVALGGLFWAGQDLAGQEEQINMDDARNQSNRLPFMPFTIFQRPTRLFQASISVEERKALFLNQCYGFLNTLAEKFPPVLQQHLGFDQAAAGEFWNPSKELIENIYVHSGSWGCGAIQTSKSGVVLFYADIGAGLSASLEAQRRTIVEKLGRPWSDQTAIEAAFTRGITGLPGESPGDGLDIAKGYVERNGGTISCRSGSAKVIFSRGSRTRISGLEFVPGVQIKIYLPTKRRFN